MLPSATSETSTRLGHPCCPCVLPCARCCLPCQGVSSPQVLDVLSRSAQGVWQNFRWKLKLLPMARGILLKQSCRAPWLRFLSSAGEPQPKIQVLFIFLKSNFLTSFFLFTVLAVEDTGKGDFIYPEAGLDEIRLLENQPQGRIIHLLF